VPDYTTEPNAFALYPPNWRLDPVPSTAARMEVYQREAPRLAEDATTRCLAMVSPAIAASVSHLLVVSCTGFRAPGLDAHLVHALGLRHDVERVMIGFMGCYAAFTALRTARTICRADPDATVLIVCVELCSLHFQREPTMTNIVANSLFGDGAAAALVRNANGDGGGGGFELVDALSRLDRDSGDQMTWTITDTGFLMRLGTEVPATLGDRIEAFVESLLARNGLRREDVGFWAVHPGGRRILEAVQSRLGLGDADMAPSFAVLEDCGNMSSPTILFVLDRILASRPVPGTYGVALAFGPGLTLESALLRAS
jgi:predicted naringenin-chalcone synthase